MTYPTVTNTVLTVSGLPLANAPVNISLSVGGFNTDDNHEMNSGVTVYTDASGVWSATLKPNPLINPNGTYYTVSEPNGARWTCIVPNGAGPYLLVNILTATPPNPTPGAPFVQSVVGQTGVVTGAQIVADSTVAGTFVHQTGNESIAGTKSFSSSPVVPNNAALDNSTKAANTAYVDTAVATQHTADAATFVPKAHVGINVLDYGTNDTAVRAAYAAAVAGASLGLGLYFPATTGGYSVTGDLVISSPPPPIWGDGDTSIITFNGGGLVYDGSAGYLTRPRLTGLQLIRSGSAAATAKGNTGVLYLKGGGAGTGVNRWFFQDIHVSSSTGDGLIIDGSYIGTFVNVILGGVIASSGCAGKGLIIRLDQVAGTVAGNAISFIGGEIQGNAYAGTIDTARTVNFYGTTIEGNSTAGLDVLSNCQNVNFYGAYFEANASWDLRVGSTGSIGLGFVVSGCHFADGGQGKDHAIELIRGQGIDIRGNYFAGTYTGIGAVYVNEASSGAVTGSTKHNQRSGGSYSGIVNIAAGTQFGAEKIGHEWVTQSGGTLVESARVGAVLHASAAVTFGGGSAIAAGASANVTITVPGVLTSGSAGLNGRTDLVQAYTQANALNGLSLLAYVSAADTVTVRGTNISGASLTPPAATVHAVVTRI